MQTVREVLFGMKELVDRAARGSVKTDGFFIACLRAAFAKSYEINLFIHDHKAGIHDFTVTAALRAPEIRKLHRTGVSKFEIARRLGSGRTSVRRILGAKS